MSVCKYAHLSIKCHSSFVTAFKRHRIYFLTYWNYSIFFFLFWHLKSVILKVIHTMITDIEQVTANDWFLDKHDGCFIWVYICGENLWISLTPRSSSRENNCSKFSSILHLYFVSKHQQEHFHTRSRVFLKTLNFVIMKQFVVSKTIVFFF